MCIISIVSFSANRTRFEGDGWVSGSELLFITFIAVLFPRRDACFAVQYLVKDWVEREELTGLELCGCRIGVGCTTFSEVGMGWTCSSNSLSSDVVARNNLPE